MKNFLLTLLIILAAASCSDKKTFCDIPEDTRPAWMEAIIEDLEPTVVYQYSYITSGVYEGQEVFVLNNCCPFCGSIFPVYTCDGTQIGAIGDEINENDIDDQAFYWAPEGVQCALIERTGLD